MAGPKTVRHARNYRLSIGRGEGEEFEADAASSEHRDDVEEVLGDYSNFREEKTLVGDRKLGWTVSKKVRKNVTNNYFMRKNIEPRDKKMDKSIERVGRFRSEKKELTNFRK